MEMMNNVYLGLGSNIGNRKENINRALFLLKDRTKFIKKSSLYETEPWGVKKQRKFYNCVVNVKTKLNPVELLALVKNIEIGMGRQKTFRNGPRVIDIDIILYNNDMIETEELTIPHFGMHERSPVLIPLAEIEPNFIHPKTGKTIKELLSKISIKGVKRL